MAEKKPIKVILQDDTGSKTMNAGSTGGSTQAQSTGSDQAKANKKSSEIVAAGTFIAMRTVSYATSNVGKWTGSRRNQTIVNNTQRVMGYGMALVTNVWMGLAVIGVDAATSIGNYMFEQSIENKRSQQAQLRIGGTGGYRR